MGVLEEKGDKRSVGVLTRIEAVLRGVGALTGVFVGVLQQVVGILEGDHIGVVSS